MEIVTKLCFSQGDASLLYCLIKSIKASDLIEFTGEKYSHDAHNGFMKLGLELANELPPSFLEEIDQDQMIFIVIRLHIDEIQYMNRCMKHDGFLHKIQARRPQKSCPTAAEKTINELCSALEASTNLCEEPYADFDARYKKGW